MGQYKVKLTVSDGHQSASSEATFTTRAPVSLVPATGQTFCYDESAKLAQCPTPGEPFYGQDASHESPIRTYTKLGADGEELPMGEGSSKWMMIRDNATGLIWERKGATALNPASQTYTWSVDPEASGSTAAYIKALNDGNYGGFNDWRMPTPRELLLLTHLQDPSPSIHGAIFTHTMHKPDAFGNIDAYWGATPLSGNPYKAWMIYFDSGRLQLDQTDTPHLVQAVRWP